METEIEKKERLEDEWLWMFLNLGTGLTNWICGCKSNNGKTREQIMQTYQKKAEGVDMESAINRYVNGLKEKYNL